MKEHYRTQGIVLKKNDRGESDRVFCVYTKDFGKLDLWAIGERKITSKLRGGLEMFYCSEIEFVQGKNKKTITDALLLEPFGIMRSDLARLRVALRILETVDMFQREHAADERVWNVLHHSLALLNNASLPHANTNLVYYYFFWNFISYEGWKPNLSTYGNVAKEMLTLLFTEDSSFLLRENKNIFSSALLNEISRKHFLRIQKELH